MGNNTLIAVIVIVLLGVVGWLAYQKGYFMGSSDSASPTPKIQINY